MDNIDQSDLTSADSSVGADSARGGARQLLALAALASSRQPLTAREVATALSIPRPSAHRVLQTLVTDGWATAHGNPTRFTTSWLVVELGFQAATGKRAREAMLAASRPLVKRTGYGSVLSFYENGTVVCSDRVELHGGEAVNRVLGHRFAADQTAAGRVFLAHLDRDDRPSSVSDDLSAHLDEIRARGYEVRNEAESPVVGSVGARSGGLAVPVFDQDLAVCGALGLMLPPGLDEAALGPLVSELQLATATASADLGGHHAVHV